MLAWESAQGLLPQRLWINPCGSRESSAQGMASKSEVLNQDPVPGVGVENRGRDGRVRGIAGQHAVGGFLAVNGQRLGGCRTPHAAPAASLPENYRPHRSKVTGERPASQSHRLM